MQAEKYIETHTDKVRSHTSDTRNPGCEAVCKTSERHYINHQPYFTVHYYPGEKPGDLEQVWYQKFEDRIICSGYNLLEIYGNLKKNRRIPLEESMGPYDPNDDKPFIVKIKHELRL